MPPTEPRIAVIVPCLNEAAAIAAVVADLRTHLPDAAIVVFDNGSTDATAARAREAGAAMRHEPRRGKGQVIRRAFADIDADIYVLIDGDGTYDAGTLPAMVALLRANTLDMVTGTRRSRIDAAYRPGHRFGNVLFTAFVGRIFGRRISDLFSGMRVFSRRFVKSFPAVATGFETETEFSVHALEMGLPLGELDVDYRERQADSASKLNTWRDGFRIALAIARLIERERPLQSFSLVALVLSVLACVLGLPVVAEFARTGLVPRLPTAVLAASLIILAALLFVTGLTLHAVTLSRKEARRLAYLALPPPSAPGDRVRPAHVRPSYFRP